MLTITIPDIELFDDYSNEFVYVKGQTLQLEHSLLSISKWESKFYKPFLTKEAKTKEETIFYIKCMTLTQNVNENIYRYGITDNIINAVNNYIDDPMTATTINRRNQPKGKDIITSEIIYYWMVSFNIPFECQKWHLNRLLMLIEVCEIKNSPKKKMSKKEIYQSNAALNAARRAAANSKG